MAKSSIHLTERVAVHLEQAGRPEAALSVLETAADEANRAGQVGRVATLHLGAFQLARRHRSLASRQAGLEDRAIEDLSQAARLSALEPLVREAWPRRGARPLAERAQLAAVFSAYLFWTGSVVEALAVATDELASLEEGGGIDHGAALLCEAALIAWFKGDGATALTFADRAADIARRTGDPDGEVRATRIQILIAYGQDRDRGVAVSRLRENALLAGAHGLAVHEGRAGAYLSFVTGRLQDAESARQEAERIGAWFWVAVLFEAGLQLMEGRRDVSEALFGQIRRELRLRTGTHAAWVDAKEACLYLHRGDLDEARNLLEGPSATADACSYGLVAAERSAAQGWLAWEEGRLQEACAHLASAGANDVIRTYATMSAGPAFALRVDALLRLGRAGEAAAAVLGFEAFDLGYDRFMAAALAAARFRLNPTPERAVTAASVTAAAPWPWLHALVGCWRGEFLQDAGAAEDARRRFEAIGAQLGIRRAQAVLRGLGVRLPRQEHGAGALSPREIEVAELIAEGLSNPAIARRLYLSRPTVASHVAHMLAKLGFSTRAQIAVWAAQRRAPAP